ncbi:unnamed protein product [Rhizopus stolonifer]
MLSFSTFLKRSVRTLTTSNVPVKDTAASWQPKKRVSRETMEKIRTLASTQPDYNTVTIAQEYKLSVEAVRRILKSKYQPNAKNAERQEKNRYKAMGERQAAFKKTEKSQYSEEFKERKPRYQDTEDFRSQEKPRYRAREEFEFQEKPRYRAREEFESQEKPRYRDMGERHERIRSQDNQYKTMSKKYETSRFKEKPRYGERQDGFRTKEYRTLEEKPDGFRSQERPRYGNMEKRYAENQSRYPRQDGFRSKGEHYESSGYQEKPRYRDMGERHERFKKQERNTIKGEGQERNQYKSKGDYKTSGKRS